MIKIKSISLLFLVFVFSSCTQNKAPKLDDIAHLASGWHGTIIAKIDQSYAGWDVEIGDADNDGNNEILTTGCPDSRLYLFKKIGKEWQTRMLAENLAQNFPGMGLAVKVVDLNHDGKNEIILGTGQETGDTARFYVFETDGSKITKKISVQPGCNKSSYTHDFAIYDLDKDGMPEVISAYCGGGEIIRYDADKRLTSIEARKLYQLSGSGEESMIADVDNDGQVEYITSNSFRAGKASVEIFEFDEHGDLVLPPRVVIDGFDGKKCFYASLVIGDVDNDGQNELIVGWKRKQNINKATVLGYRVSDKAVPIYTFANEDKDLDMAYFEKMMAVADANNDGKNELVISTRGDNQSEKIASEHLGYVFLYKIDAERKIHKTLLVDFNKDKAESSWLAVGDADNDGRNEIILATGKGDRTKKGTSYVVLIKKNNE
ncbi:MAG: VCBS repeat-containing protein [Calditrichaeota bacterium]|nr:VCBS repeat-containing protein [Calditrichota bacterium]